MVGTKAMVFPLSFCLRENALTSAFSMNTGMVIGSPAVPIPLAAINRMICNTGLNV